MDPDKEIAVRVAEMLEKPVAALGYQLLEVQYRFEGRWVLRLLIDRPEGIGIEDCTAVTELAGRMLDVEDPIAGEFALEVSSPGIFRPLKEARHFGQSVGKTARLSLRPGVLGEGKDKVVRCRIAALKEEILVVELNGKTLELPLSGIRSARLDP